MAIYFFVKRIFIDFCACCLFVACALCRLGLPVRGAWLCASMGGNGEKNCSRRKKSKKKGPTFPDERY